MTHNLIQAIATQQTRQLAELCSHPGGGGGDEGGRGREGGREGEGRREGWSGK